MSIKSRLIDVIDRFRDCIYTGGTFNSQPCIEYKQRIICKESLTKCHDNFLARTRCFVYGKMEKAKKIKDNDEILRRMREKYSKMNPLEEIE